MGRNFVWLTEGSDISSIDCLCYREGLLIVSWSVPGIASSLTVQDEYFNLRNTFSRTDHRYATRSWHLAFWRLALGARSSCHPSLDDGSLRSAGHEEVLECLAQYGPCLRAAEDQRNRGHSFALSAGCETAKRGRENRLANQLDPDAAKTTMQRTHRQATQ